MTQFLEAAVGYHARGWSVIPVRSKSKIPLVPWAQYEHERASLEQIHAWWERWPDANVGVVTGLVSGIIVVDVDVRHGGDPQQAYGTNPTGLIQRTGSGGWHLFYTYPPNGGWVSNRTNAKDGIDVRADGGYVVVPPSVHDTGGRYVWTAEGEPQLPPAWAIAAEKDIDPTDQSGKDHWLADVLGGVKAGGRNDAMAKLAGYFAGKKIPQDVILSLIKMWNQSNEDPASLTSREMESTVNSVCRAAKRNAKPAHPADTKRLQEQAEFQVLTLSRYGAMFGAEEIRWTVEEWLPEKTICFAVSPPGMYKTWMLMDLAVSVASGKPFLGHYPVSDPGPVMLVQQEDYHGSIVERIGTVIKTRFDLEHPGGSEDFLLPGVPNIPIYVHPHRRLRFDDDDVLSQFTRRVHDLKPKLVIIDPLYSAVSTDDYMTRAAEELFVLKSLRDVYGTSFVVAHHTRKGEQGGRMDAWGTQFLNAFLETGWQIREGEGKNDIKVSRHFKVSNSPPTLDLHFDIETGGDAHYEVSILEEEEPTDPATTVLMALSGKDLTQTAISKELHIRHGPLKTLLTQMVADGRVLRKPDGRYTLGSGAQMPLIGGPP
jgi:hypothetical protein